MKAICMYVRVSLCVCVCGCKLVPIVFTHSQSRHQKYHFHPCNNCKKVQKRRRDRYRCNEWIEVFIERYNGVSLCVFVCEFVGYTSRVFRTINMKVNSESATTHTMQQLIMEIYGNTWQLNIEQSREKVQGLQIQN